MGIIFLFGNSQSENWAPTGCTIIHFWDQLRHVSCGHSRGGEFAQFDEKVLQLVRAGNNDPNAEDIKFEEEPERRKVAIEERVLVIPFGLYGDAVLVIINVVRGSKGLMAVSQDLDVEALFNPSSVEKKAVNGSCDRRLIAALLGEIGPPKLEFAQNLDKIFPLVGKIGFQDGTGVVAFLDLVGGSNVLWE
jgi:hypothetical protein